MCFSMCIGVMRTALASPLYPLYQQAWGLQPSHITQIFVTYMLGARISSPPPPISRLPTESDAPTSYSAL